MAPKTQYEYPARVPTCVPEGMCLVHNQVVTPTRRQGWRGSRYWLQPVAAEFPPLERCHCGWASELPEHYRVTGTLTGETFEDESPVVVRDGVIVWWDEP